MLRGVNQVGDNACTKVQLRTLGEDISETLDYVPGYFKVHRHVRPKLACRTCSHIEQVPAPSRPITRGMADAGLLAQVVVAKYADHTPLYRQEQIYRRAGVQLERATLAAWVRESSRLLEPLRGTRLPFSSSSPARRASRSWVTISAA